MAEGFQRGAEVVLGHGPGQRHTVAGAFQQGVAIGGDGLFQPRRAGFALAEGFESNPQIIERSAGFICTLGAGLDCVGKGDGNHQVQVQPLVAAAFVPFAPENAQVAERGAPACVHIGQRHQVGCGGGGVAAQQALIDGHAEKARFLRIGLRQSVVNHRLRSIKVVGVVQAFDLVQHRIDLVTQIARAIHAPGNLNRAFQFPMRGIDVGNVGGDALGKADEQLFGQVQFARLVGGLRDQLPESGVGLVQQAQNLILKRSLKALCNRVVPHQCRKDRA